MPLHIFGDSDQAHTFVATAEDAEQRRNEEDFKDAALRPVATPSGTGTGGLSALRAPAQATPATERDETVASVPRQAIQNTNELIGWASAQARKGNLQIAEDAFRDALQRDPDNNDCGFGSLMFRRPAAHTKRARMSW